MQDSPCLITRSCFLWSTRKTKTSIIAFWSPHTTPYVSKQSCPFFFFLFFCKCMFGTTYTSIKINFFRSQLFFIFPFFLLTFSNFKIDPYVWSHHMDFQCLKMRVPLAIYNIMVNKLIHHIHTMCWVILFNVGCPN